MKKSSKNQILKLKTVKDFIFFAMEQFKQHKIYFGHGTDNVRDEAIYLILSTLHLPIILDKSLLSKQLSHSEKEKILKKINDRIKKRIPTAYLTQEAWFCGLPFYVNEKVLIPRSPLAEIIEKCFVPWINPKKVSRILDIGTGSGCIAISCAYAFPHAKIDAIDISSKALKIAMINCIRHKMTKRVSLLKSDLFKKLKGKTYDIIISNPPYVSESEMNFLPKEYYHEPKDALCAGPIGDEIITRIIKDAAKYLSPKGILVVEVGNSFYRVLQKYQHLPLIWLEFERGEGEVFLLTREHLMTFVRKYSRSRKKSLV